MDSTLLPGLSKLGFKVIDPWELTDKAKLAEADRIPYGELRRQAWQKLDVEIGDNNRHGIDSAWAVVAVLDGVDVDSGTASEIGYAFAKGKRIFGYRSDFRLSSDNEGSTVNLQVSYFITKSGGKIVSSVEDLFQIVSSSKQ